MNVFFIMGLPHSGKSTYIHDSFDLKEVEYVDVLDSEILTKDIAKAALMARLQLDVALGNARIESKDVVFELPGLTKNQRAYFIRRVKNIAREGDSFAGIWIESPEIDITKRINLNGVDGEEVVNEKKQLVENPSVEEGFDRVEIVRNVGVPDDFILPICF